MGNADECLRIISVVLEEGGSATTYCTTVAAQTTKTRVFALQNWLDKETDTVQLKRTFVFLFVVRRGHFRAEERPNLELAVAYHQLAWSLGYAFFVSW